jgi:hypothetical protein
MHWKIGAQSENVDVCGRGPGGAGTQRDSEGRKGGREREIDLVAASLVLPPARNLIEVTG